MIDSNEHLLETTNRMSTKMNPTLMLKLSEPAGNVIKSPLCMYLSNKLKIKIIEYYGNLNELQFANSECTMIEIAFDKILSISSGNNFKQKLKNLSL